MNLHIAICDDEQTEIKYLRTLVGHWADERGFAVHISTFESAESFLFTYEENKSFDILLLDIEMGKMNGVELAIKVRVFNKEVQIIFITGYMEYISDGYDVEALHYLLKPVTENKLFRVLGRAVEKLSRNERALLLDLGGESVRIPLYEIRFLEVQRNYVTIHAKENYTIKTTLSEIEKELDDSFFRTGRSYIINLRYIRRITKTDVYISDGAIIPLSRGLYDALNHALIERL